MENVKHLIEILEQGNLKYAIQVKLVGGIIRSFYKYGAEKIDERYLLRGDTSGIAGKIFGIADTPKEADERLHFRTLEVVKSLETVYKEEGEIEVKDKTKYANK